MIFARRGMLLLLLYPLLSGCGAVVDLRDMVGGGSGGNEIQVDAEKLAIFEAAPNVPLLWKNNVRASQAAVFSPVYEQGVVYAADTTGQLAGFDVTTGKQQWAIDTKRKLSGGVGVGDGVLLLGTFKGEVLAFDEKGTALWTTQVSSEILSAPQIADGMVVVRTGDGRIFGLDANDGKRKWVYQGPTPSLTVRSFAGVLISRGMVFAGFPGGKLVSITLASGGINWEVAVSRPRGATELERITDITSLPVADEAQVCAVAYQGRIACFEVVAGNQIWARDVSSNTGLAMDGNYVYVSEDKGSVVAYDKRTGVNTWKQEIPVGKRKSKLLWVTESRGISEAERKKSEKPLFLKQETLTSSRLSAPLVQGDRIIVSDSLGNVIFLKQDDGAILARSSTDDSAIVARPEPFPNGLVVQTAKGGLHAFPIQ